MSPSPPGRDNFAANGGLEPRCRGPYHFEPFQPSNVKVVRDAAVIDVLHALLADNDGGASGSASIGSGSMGMPGITSACIRVCCGLRLNLPRRTRRRVPPR